MSIEVCGDCLQTKRDCPGPFGACGVLPIGNIDDDLLGGGIEPESGYDYLNAD